MRYYKYYNPNPRHRNQVGDCTIRSLSKALNVPWESAYVDLVIQGYLLGDMPSSNFVVSSYLQSQGFTKHIIENHCPDDCYTINDFAADHPKGTYILGTGSHLVTVKDGMYHDSWDSGDEVPIYYYEEGISW